MEPADPRREDLEEDYSNGGPGPVFYTRELFGVRPTAEDLPEILNLNSVLNEKHKIFAGLVRMDIDIKNLWTRRLVRFRWTPATGSGPG